MVCSPDEMIDGVTYFNELSNQELSELYRRAHVFCMPSTYEGFGLPYLEALASGTLVITTPNPGANEILANGEYGVIIEDNELASSIIDALRNSEKYKSMVQKGLNSTNNQSWESVIRKYLSYLN